MHEGFDGQKQRNALNAAESALRALSEGKADQARKAAARAAELDQIGVYVDFANAVVPLADGLDDGVAVDDAGWNTLVDTLGLGPLSGLVDELRH